MLRHFSDKVRRLADNEDGVTAMEYGLIAAAVITAVASLLTGVSPVVGSFFHNLSTSL